MAKAQQKRPDALLIEIAAAEVSGTTKAEIGAKLGISSQAVSERINRDRDLYDEIKTSYLKGLAYQRGINDAKA